MAGGPVHIARTMNRNCYRLRLHIHTGQMVPVAEIHAARGRAPAGAARRARRRNRLTLTLALSSLALLAQAQARQTAANSVPVYDIAPADAQGLSHNRYPDLQVAAPGAVFNNSLDDGRSQLAGYITRNPRLGPDTQASTILAEVQAGGAVSRLAGALEVFGPKAALIIANPNGIYANGVSTINISNLSLVAGASQPGRPGLYLRTGPGAIEVGPAGVNTDGLRTFDLIARQVRLHGPVGPGSTAGQSGARLGVYAGSYAWEPLENRLTALPGQAPAAQISGSAVGAMHGSHITLVASGSGAGVRLPGALLSASDVLIQADGDITLASAHAAGGINVQAGRSLQLEAPIRPGPALLSGTAIALQAGEHILMRGDAIAVQGPVRILASRLNNDARIDAAQGSLFLRLGDGLRNTGTIHAAQHLDLQAGGLENAGSLQTEGTLQAHLGTALVNDGSLDARAGMALAAGALTNRGAISGGTLNARSRVLANAVQLQSRGAMRVQVAQTLINEGLIETGGQLDLQLQQLQNQGRLQAHTLRLQGMDARNAGDMRSQGDMLLNVAQSLNNTGSQAAGQDFFIYSAQLLNSGQLDAGRDFAFLDGALKNSGNIHAKQRAQLRLTSYRNSGGIAAADLTLNSAQPLELAGQAPEGRERLSISAPSLVLRQGLSTPGKLILLATQGDLDNHDAILAGGTLQASAARNLRNHDRALLWSAEGIGLQVQETLDNGIHSLIASSGALAIEANGQLLNRQGRIEADGDLRIDTPRLLNRATLSGQVWVDPGQGAILDKRRYSHYRDLRWVHLEIAGFTAGRLLSTLRADPGVILAGGNLDINQHRRRQQHNQVLNQGRIEAGGQLRIDADVDNQSLSRRMSTRDYLRAVGPLTSQVWDSLASASWEDRRYASLYDLLDYSLAGTDNWTTLFVAYNYNHTWLSDALALFDLSTAPELAGVLAQALGDDWRGISREERSARWQAFKRGERGASLAYYPQQRTVLGAFGGVTVHGRLRNGDHVQGTPAPRLPDAPLSATIEQIRANWPGQLAAPPSHPQTPAPLPPADPARNRLPDDTADNTPAERDDFTGKPLRRPESLRTDALLDALRDTLANPHLFAHGTMTGQAPEPYYETRLKFIDPQRFYGSAYFFEQIGYKPHARQYVGGDNVFDTTLINRQAERQLGAQSARQAQHGSTRAKQYLDNAAQVHARLGLVVGQPLTRHQLDQLDRDIVWYVKVEHQGQTLLMPRLYLGAASRSAAQDIRAAGGAAIASAGLLDIDTGDGAARDIVQHNALLLGRDVRLRAGGGLSLTQDDSVHGGILTDGRLDAQANDLLIRGARIAGRNLVLRADRDMEIVTGMQAGPDGARRKDAYSGLYAQSGLTLQAGRTLLTRGATLQARHVTLEAQRLLLDEVREQSGALVQEGHIGTFSYSAATTRHTLDQGAGSTVHANALRVRVQGDMGMRGGLLQAERSDVRIGGNLTTVASATHRTQDRAQHSLAWSASGRAGAGGQEVSFNSSSAAGVSTQHGQGSMAGAELKTGLQLASSTQRHRSLIHSNSQLNLGEGQLLANGVFDLGGADLNADRAQSQARHAGLLQVQAAHILTTRYENTTEEESSGWSFFAGNKFTARSSLLDTASNLATLAQQAAEGREVDPALTALQVAGNVNNLLLNDTGEVASGMGMEGSYQRSQYRRYADNTHLIGGSVRLRSTQGDIDLAGTTFAGGATVALQARGNLTLRSAQEREYRSGEQHNVSAYVNGTASCNAFQASCGTGVNVSVAGSSTLDQSERLTQLHSRLQAGQVQLVAGQDLNLLGAQADAAGQLFAQVGGNLNLITRRDTQRSKTEGGDWNASLGVAANTRTLGTPTASLGATVRLEHDNAAIASQASGLQAARLQLAVRGDARLRGGLITASGTGSTVAIQGRTTVSDLQDWRDHDGGYFGASIGISATTSMPSGSVSGGRIAGERYAATRRATIDVGQTRGQGRVQTRGGVSGTLNQAAGQALRVETDRQWAQNDISFTLSSADPLGRKARQQKRQQAAASPPAATGWASVPPAPSAPRTKAKKTEAAAAAAYGQRIVVLADADPQARQAAERLTAKHADTTTLMQRGSDGTLQTMLAAPQPRPGPIKVQVVGHGDNTPSGQATLGGHNASELAATLRQLPSADIRKIALVSCGSGSCPGQDLSSQLQQTLGPDAPAIKGYATRLDVTAEGRKYSVVDGGLGPKRDRGRPAAGAPAPAPPAASGTRRSPTKTAQAAAAATPGAKTKKAPAQAPDVLAHYLSDPVNKARFDFVLGDDMENIDRTHDPAFAVKGMQVYQTGDPYPKHIYTNSIGPQAWHVRQPALRATPEPRFTTTDTVIATYIKAAQAGGFYNQQPRQLTLTVASHEVPRLERLGPDAPATQFLASAPTGTRAKRIMQAIGVETTGLEFEKSTRRLTLALKPKPGASEGGDILADYLAQPERKQAIEHLLDPSAFYWRKPDDTSPDTYELSDRDLPLPRNLFVNAYSPDTWIMQSIARPNRQRPYFANDVVLAQYARVSKQYGYYGKLPSRIVSENISNAQTLAFLEAGGSAPDLQGYLNETPNGKHTQRFLENLQMHATRLEWDPATSNSVVHVRPNASAAARPAASHTATAGAAAAGTQASRYGARIVVLSEDDPAARQAAKRLAAKHPRQTTLMRRLPDGRLRTLGPSATAASGPVKIQVVGHGGGKDGAPTLGGLRPDQLARTLRPVMGGGTGHKISLVSCASGACPGQDFGSLLQAELPQASVKGYAQRVDVGPDGRKHLVAEGGLGPKRDRSRPGDAPRRPGMLPMPKAGATGTKSSKAGTPAPAKDVLAHYLSDPVNKARFDFVLGSDMDNTDRSQDPAFAVKGMQVYQTSDPYPAHLYTNSITPEQWIIRRPDRRKRPEPRFNTTDVAIASYIKAARDGDFYNQRPQKLTLGLESQEFRQLNQLGPSLSLADFLATAPSGTRAGRIMQAIGVEPTGLDFERSNYRVTLDLETMPQASPDGDILAGYLAQPERRQAVEQLLDSPGFHWKKSGEGSQNTYELADRDTARPLNVFINAYSPDTWLMQSNARLNPQRPYFANDVVLAQYATVSKAHGYYGKLPTTIVRDNIINAHTLAFFEKAGETPDLQGFLTETPNGKHTQRILQNLQMHATQLDWNARTATAVIHVRPDAGTTAQAGATAARPDTARPQAAPAGKHTLPARPTTVRPRQAHTANVSAAPAAAGTSQQRRVVLLSEDSAAARQAAAGLVSQSPSHTTLMRRLPDDRLRILGPVIGPASGPLQIQVVGRGGQRDGAPTLGGQHPAQLAQTLRPLLGSGSAHTVALIFCASGACPGRDFGSLLQAELPQVVVKEAAPQADAGSRAAQGLAGNEADAGDRAAP